MVVIARGLFVFSIVVEMPEFADRIKAKVRILLLNFFDKNLIA